MIRHLVVTCTLALSVMLVGCGKKSSGKPTPELAPRGTPIAITVTNKGFEPDHILVEKGVETQLVFTRKTEQTCAKDVVLTIDASNQIRKDLPMNQPVTITATFPVSGELRYACGMDMISGVITVQ
ncbi:MAG: cupredoxin domain-containing protein [Deltaproteobacteria bacterium]|nr:cupredoxin domain-containing protein [Deltaproteobacteria bacterium]